MFFGNFDLPTYTVLLYNVRFWGLSWTPIPTLILDVIINVTHKEAKVFMKKKLNFWCSLNVTRFCQHSTNQQNFMSTVRILSFTPFYDMRLLIFLMSTYVYTQGSWSLHEKIIAAISQDFDNNYNEISNTNRPSS